MHWSIAAHYAAECELWGARAVRSLQLLECALRNHDLDWFDQDAEAAYHAAIWAWHCARRDEFR